MSIASSSSLLRPVKHPDRLLTKWSSIIKTVHAMCKRYFMEYYTAAYGEFPCSFSVKHCRCFWVHLTSESEDERGPFILTSGSCIAMRSSTENANMATIYDTMQLMINIIRRKEVSKIFCIKAADEGVDYTWELSYVQLTQLFGALFILLRDYLELYISTRPNVYPDNERKILEDTIKDFLPRCISCYKSQQPSLIGPRPLFEIALNSMFKDEYKQYVSKVNYEEESLVECQVRNLMAIEPRMLQRLHGRDEIAVTASVLDNAPKIVLRKWKPKSWCIECDLLPLFSLIPDYEEKIGNILCEVMLQQPNV